MSSKARKSLVLLLLQLTAVSASADVLYVFGNPLTTLHSLQTLRRLHSGLHDYQAKKDKEGNVVESRLGRRINGDLALLAVMEKQKGWGDDFPEGLKNGDWVFAAFTPDGTRAKKGLNECRACHAPLTDRRQAFSFKHFK